MESKGIEKIVIENNETKNYCAECGGKCCLHNGCEVFPCDVFGDEEPTIEKLMEFLSSGRFAIDWWDGDVEPYDEYYKVYYIRSRHVGHNDLYDEGWGGKCVSLTDTGCSLDFAHRPTGGKALHCDGKENGRFICRASYSKKESVLAWRPFYDWLDGFKQTTLNEKGGFDIELL